MPCWMRIWGYSAPWYHQRVRYWSMTQYQGRLRYGLFKKKLLGTNTVNKSNLDIYFKQIIHFHSQPCAWNGEDNWFYYSEMVYSQLQFAFPCLSASSVQPLNDYSVFSASPVHIPTAPRPIYGLCGWEEEGRKQDLMLRFPDGKAF